jgi:hypothetical protein
VNSVFRLYYWRWNLTYISSGQLGTVKRTCLGVIELQRKIMTAFWFQIRALSFTELVHMVIYCAVIYISWEILITIHTVHTGAENWTVFSRIDLDQYTELLRRFSCENKAGQRTLRNLLIRTGDETREAQAEMVGVQTAQSWRLTNLKKWMDCRDIYLWGDC